MKTPALILLLQILTLVPAPVAAAEPTPAPDTFVNPKASFILQAGVMLPASDYLWVNKPDEGGDGMYWSVGLSPVIGARATLWFSNTAALDTYLDLAHMPSESGKQRTLVSFGLALKFGIINRATWQARLGGGAGVNVFSAEVLDDWGLGTVIGINPFALFEVAFRMSERLNFLVGYHFNAMIGETQNKASWPPLHIVTAGLEF